MNICSRKNRSFVFAWHHAGVLAAAGIVWLGQAILASAADLPLGPAFPAPPTITGYEAPRDTVPLNRTPQPNNPAQPLNQPAQPLIRTQPSPNQLVQHQLEPAPSGDMSESISGTASVAVPISAAEQLSRLEKMMQIDAQRLQELRSELTDPNSEYRLAEASFKQFEQELQAAQTNLAGAVTLDSAQLAALQQRVAELTKKLDLSRQRFDLAIQTRITLQEQVTALEAKLKQEQLAHDKLSGNVRAAAEPVTASSMMTVSSPNPAVSSSSAPRSEENAPLPANPAITANSNVAPPEQAKPQQAEASLLPAPAAPKAPSKELVAAKNQALLKSEDARAAHEEAESVTARIVTLDKDIELENKMLAATRKKTDIAYQTMDTIKEMLEKRRLANAPEFEQAELRTKYRDAEQQFRAARAEIDERANRLTSLLAQRSELQNQERTAVHQAQAKLAEAQVAEAKVTELKNPFSLQNLLQWLLDHGPKISIVLIAMLLFRRTMSLAKQRVMQLMIARGVRGTLQEREDRAKTLVGVFHNAASLLILVTGTLMICEEIGISVGPLMGGAAMLGLAFAFGAQNLIRDYFYGFVVLLENQYKINDVLRIGEISGQVEQITLRMTVLRDLDGNVHFIPNGKIDSVTNMTHGWSRAKIEIGISYSEDTDRVMLLLLEIVNEMRQEAEYDAQIVAEPEMLGVDELGDSAVKIVFLVKTRPLCQWKVKRELLRRIKHRFDELGIEIPFPQRVVTHRYEHAEGTEPSTVLKRLAQAEEEETQPLRKSA